MIWLSRKCLDIHHITLISAGHIYNVKQEWAFNINFPTICIPTALEQQQTYFKFVLPFQLCGFMLNNLFTEIYLLVHQKVCIREFEDSQPLTFQWLTTNEIFLRG